MRRHTDSSRILKFAGRQGEIPPGSHSLSSEQEEDAMHFIIGCTHSPPLISLIHSMQLQHNAVPPPSAMHKSARDTEKSKQLQQ